MKKLAFFAVAALASTPVMAQMPVPLIDDAVDNSEQWKIAAPMVQAGLECRQQINRNNPALRSLLPSNDTWQWNLVPPKGFTVFGLPVQSITIYIDPAGEMGASYTASVAAPKAAVIKAAKLNGQRKTKIGSLMAKQGSQPSLTDITCTVSGSREEE
ncbi:MAG: hypothetical protein ACPLXR_09945 [Halothiobacillaceae bacterium]|jgi:hypothetical protein